MIAGLMEWLTIASVRVLAGAQPKARSFSLAHAPRQCIFLANHSSHLDAVLLLASLPRMLRRRTRPVAAADYWNAGPIRRFVIHSIFRGVLLEGGKNELNPLEPVAAALRCGDSLIFFPEGTRGPGGTLLPLKPGIFYLAKSFPEIDIIPVWIGNSYRVLRKGSSMPLPMPCSVTFGAALRWKPGQQQQEFLDQVRETLEALKPSDR